MQLPINPWVKSKLRVNPSQIRVLPPALSRLSVLSSSITNTSGLSISSIAVCPCVLRFQYPVTKMVCLACLLPLFLVPIVNFLPLLFYYVMGKVYGLLGWEYRKPGAPVTCPYKPAAKKDSRAGNGTEPGLPEPVPKSAEVDSKED